ncbi:MAG: hypothetical protein ACRD0C_23255 [Acidimicrobiia bacterium]
MDLNSAITMLPAALVLTAVTPLVRRVRATRAARRDAHRYLEALLVEARSYSFPVAARHI